MIGKEAADEIVRIADTRRHHIVGSQQEARRFDATGGEHHDFRFT